MNSNISIYSSEIFNPLPLSEFKRYTYLKQPFNLWNSFSSSGTNDPNFMLVIELALPLPLTLAGIYQLFSCLEGILSTLWSILHSSYSYSFKRSLTVLSILRIVESVIMESEDDELDSCSTSSMLAELRARTSACFWRTFENSCRIFWLVLASSASRSWLFGKIEGEMENMFLGGNFFFTPKKPDGSLGIS